mmetsp:Transcript_57229/g.124375  ORF Transcript_57229/g.124375 Transcript_57229/m.124375 type:complete len:88 (-) Transcript_57229:346-609(-)
MYSGSRLDEAVRQERLHGLDPRWGDFGLTDVEGEQPETVLSNGRHAAVGHLRTEAKIQQREVRAMSRHCAYSLVGGSLAATKDKDLQ